MSTTPKMPTKPYVDAQGNPTENFEKWLQALWQQAGSSNNKLTANVDSGIAIAQAAKAAAAAAQGTANGAAAGVGNLAGQVLTFRVTVDLPSAYGEVSIPGPASTAPVTATAAGSFVAPLSYLWTITGTDIVIDDPTSATTTFSTPSIALGDTLYETATITVTDSTPGTPLVCSTTAGVTIYAFDPGPASP